VHFLPARVLDSGWAVRGLSQQLPVLPVLSSLPAVPAGVLRLQRRLPLLPRRLLQLPNQPHLHWLLLHLLPRSLGPMHPLHFPERFLHLLPFLDPVHSLQQRHLPLGQQPVLFALRQYLFILQQQPAVQSLRRGILPQSAEELSVLPRQLQPVHRQRCLFVMQLRLLSVCF
jgi:hypothetical protein